MRILMLSRDVNTQRPGTPAFSRMAEYRALVDELIVVVPFGVQLLKLFFSGKKFDLVTSQDPFETGIIAYLFAKRFNAKLELQVHTDFANRYYREESLKNRLRVFIAQRLLPKAQCVRAVSLRIKRSLVALDIAEAKVSVLPIWVDVERFANPASSVVLRVKYPQFKTIGLMISRLAQEKNIQRAIRAFAYVVKKNPDTGLVIVGDGPLKNELVALSKSLGISNSVFFEPWTADAPSYFASADFFLSVSRYEGYGLTLVESAVAGCPIATTDVGLVGDILGYEDVAVMPEDGDVALADSIEKLIRDSNRRESLRMSARTRVSGLQPRQEYLQSMSHGWLSCGS